VNVVMGILTGDWGRAWDGIKGIVSAVWDAITGLTRIAIETMRGVLGGLLDLLGDIGGRLMGVARSGIAAVWDEITRQVGVFVRGVRDSLEGIVTTLLEMPARAMSAAQSLGGAIKDGLVAGIKGTIGAIGSLEEQLLSAIKGILNSAIDAINDAIPDSIGFTVAGKDFKIGLPANPIPRLASGGIITRPGLAVVGEAGPELVLLPAQAAVLPNAIARAVAGAVGDRGPSVTVQILGPVTIGGEADLQRAVGDLGWGLAASLRARGVM
jgi:phage-related protein